MTEYQKYNFRRIFDFPTKMNAEELFSVIAEDTDEAWTIATVKAQKRSAQTSMPTKILECVDSVPVKLIAVEAFGGKNW
jgi:hypothetical protein